MQKIILSVLCFALAGSAYSATVWMAETWYIQEGAHGLAVDSNGVATAIMPDGSGDIVFDVPWINDISTPRFNLKIWNTDGVTFSYVSGGYGTYATGTTSGGGSFIWSGSYDFLKLIDYGDFAWYEVFKVSDITNIPGVTDQTEIYDWGGEIFYNASIDDALYELQALVNGEWVVVQTMAVEGRTDFLDSPTPFDWGEVEAPSGVVQWRMEAIQGDISNVTSEGADGWGNPRGNIQGFVVMGERHTSPQFIYTDDTSQVTTLPVDAFGNVTGLDNIVDDGVTNQTELDAAAVMAGIKMAQQYVADGVGDGIDQSDLAAFLRTNSDFYGINNGISAVNDAVNGVNLTLGSANQHLQDVVAAMNSGISPAGETFGDGSEVITNKFDSKLVDVESGGDGVSGFIDTMTDMFTVTPIQPVYQIQFTLAGVTKSLDFSAAEYDTCHTILEYLVHVTMIFAVIAIVRSAIA